MTRGPQHRTAALAVCLLLAGCGSQVTVHGSGSQGSSALNPTGVGDTSGGTVDTTAPAGGTSTGAVPTQPNGTTLGSTGGTGTTGGTTGGSSGAGTTGAEPVAFTGHNGTGVTATTIKIGFIGIDASSQAETNTLFGVTTPPANTQDAVNAVVAYVNAHGGIGGRKIIPYYVERKTASTDPNSDEALCTQLTEDDKVFAVVTNSAGGEEPCYAKHHTILLDDTNIAQKDLMQKYTPYIWSPGLVAKEAAYSAEIDGLVGQGWFGAGSKTGLLGFDDPSTIAIYKSVVVPQLARIGKKFDDAVFMSQPESDSDDGKMAQDIQNTVLKFNGEHINRVMFMAPGAAVPLIFMNQAESQQYHPTYGLSSNDSPGFLLQGKAPDAQLKNAKGAGFTMLTDVDSQHGDPYPAGSAEKQCLSILKSTANAPSSRGAAFAAAYICDGAFMLQTAARGMVNRGIDAVTWGAAAERMGRDFQAGYSLPGGTAFRPGMHAGGAYYRWLAFHDACKCFEYTSGNKPIPAI